MVVLTRITRMSRRLSSSTSGKIRRRVTVTNRDPCPFLRWRMTLLRPTSTDARSDHSAVHQTDDGSRAPPSIRLRTRDRTSTLMPDSPVVRTANGCVTVSVPNAAGNDAPPNTRIVTGTKPQCQPRHHHRRTESADQAHIQPSLVLPNRPPRPTCQHRRRHDAELHKPDRPSNRPDKTDDFAASVSSNLSIADYPDEPNDRLALASPIFRHRSVTHQLKPDTQRSTRLSREPAC